MTKTELAAKQYLMENSAKDVSTKESFEEGADYMLERVCEWLEEYADGFGIPESESGGVYVDDLISELRKDMEE